MNVILKATAAAMLAAALAVSCATAAGPAVQAQEHHAKRRGKTPPQPSVEEQIQALRQELQSQIDELKQELANKDEQLRQAQQAAATAQGAADKAQASASQQQQAVNENASAVSALQSSVNGLRSSSSSLESNFETVQKEQKEAVKRSELSDLAFGKVKIGATFYGFYSVFPQTGFGPQTLDNTDIYPGPGNDGYNEFNINRTYITFHYQPIKAVTFRVTPNIYRETGGTTAEKLSSTSATGGNYNGNYGFRLKYAYVDFNSLFAKSKMFGKDKLTFGQQQQPLTDWEEHLYGYRYVNLTPWNYWSLSSTYPGLKLHGPIMVNGKQYLDYEIGAFDDASFHAYEVGERKQGMVRVSWFPFGAVSQFQGFGLTGFVDYGYKDAAPDTSTKVPETRVAALAHYQSRSGDDGIAFEYDWGHNAFSEGNLFSGSGPADYFGAGTTKYAAWSSLVGALLGGTHTQQQGIDFFGHARLAKSPYYLFGMFENLKPNTRVDTDPIDFNTVIAGIAYHYGKNWQFALDSKNIIYYHGQFTFPASELAKFSPSLAAANPNGIPNAVPVNTNQVSFNVLFDY